MGRAKEALSKGRSFRGDFVIFVTVGTHEQPFDRLVKKIDELKKNGLIKDDVFIQTGYSDYVPKYCSYKKMIDFKEMYNYCQRSEIIITHGGPGSIMMPLSMGKKPIVVPRQNKFNEHVDDHQVLFAKRLEAESKILTVIDINEIEDYILNYFDFVKKNYLHKSNLPNFINKLNELTDKLVSEI